MNWSDFYLLCFLIGFSLSVLSLLAGISHWHLPFRVHVPFLGGHHSGHTGPSHGGVKGGTHISWFNASTAMAFLAWFGGTGYILTQHSHLLAFTSLGIATLSGLVAGTLVFRFMAKIIKTTEAQLLDWDFRI